MRLKKSEQGSLNVLLIPLILSILFFFGALGFGVWAFMEREDYKKNSDEKSQKAVAIAVERTKTEKDNEFLEREKEPLRDYKGPAALGSFTMKYPKTWSAYADESTGKTSVIFHPLVIPADRKVGYALRVEVLDSPYSRNAKIYDNDVKTGKAKAAPYALPKVPDVLGLKVDGQISEEKRGSVVLLPLRDKTLRISTESEEYLVDFNGIILPNFVFQP